MLPLCATEAVDKRAHLHRVSDSCNTPQDMVVYERVAREVEDKWVMSEEVASELRLQVEALMAQNTATQAQLQQQVLLLLVNFAPAFNSL